MISVASKKRVAVVALLLGSVTCVAVANEASVELQRNPFDRPAEEAQATNSVIANTHTTDESDQYLRAVLVAGKDSVANFGGVILRIGETSNGYRLISVSEHQATFRKDDTNIVFFVDDSEEGKDL